MTSFQEWNWKKVVFGIGVASVSSAFLYRFYIKSFKYSSYTTSEEVMDGIDLNGKFAIITGCNTGIGKETAKHLVKHGCHVIMACRNIKKAEKAKNDIIDNVLNNKNYAKKIDIFQCDLSSLKSVRNFSNYFNKKYSNFGLDYLINNAAVSYDTYHETNDKFEIHFGVNYLSHLYLTQLLLDIMKPKKGRIINVTSKMHSMVPVSLLNDFHSHCNVNDKDYKSNTIEWFKKNWNYTIYAAYGLSKAFLVLITRELHQRYNDKDGIVAVSVDPGLVETQIGSKNITHFGWFWYLGEMIRPIIGKTLSQGAATTLRCVVMSGDQIESGCYYAHCNKAEGQVGNIAKPNKEIQQNLWNLSSLLTKSLI